MKGHFREQQSVWTLAVAVVLCSIFVVSTASVYTHLGLGATTNFSEPHASNDLIGLRILDSEIATNKTLLTINSSGPIIDSVGQWEILPPAPQKVGNNNGHRIEAMSNYVYFYPANGLFAFYRYSYAGGWETLPSIPTFGGNSYGIGLVRAKDPAGTPAIYVIGGNTTNGVKGWYRYTDAGGWSGPLNTNIPWGGSAAQLKPRNGSEFVWDNGDNIYYFPGSGYTGYNQYDWYRYSISLDSWYYMGEIPGTSPGDPKNGPGNSACLVTIGAEKYIYIQFGHTPSGIYQAAQFWRYKISDNTWTKLTQTGYGADDGADLVWDGGDYLYLSPGAYIETSSGGCDEYLFLRYSIYGDNWEDMTEQPGKQGNGHENGSDDGGASAIVGDYIYRLKGGDGNGEFPADNFYRYQMPPKTPTARATGPMGTTNDNNVTLTYTYTLSPTSVNLYYTENTSSPYTWTLAGNDTSVDGTFAYIPSDGTYGWNAVAIGGGSTETNPPENSTPPEASWLILDTVAPTVSYVTSTKAAGIYSVCVVIPVTVTFSENVNVTGTPQLTLATGGAGTAVNYTSGSGTTTLTFNYTVAPGDNSADLDYVATTSLALNGGTIKDNAGNNAILTLLTPGAENSLGYNKDIVIDTTSPYWLQTTWSGGPTTPSLQVGTWAPSYDNFYDNENVDWSASVKLKSQPGGVYENGWFESSIYDAGSSQNWGAVTWSASTPSFGGLDNYTYVSSYAAVNGAVENFAGEQQADGGYATLGGYIANHVVISEFSTRGPGGAYDEFVELYNPTDHDINVGGWQIWYYSTNPETGEYWWTYYSYQTSPGVGTIPAGTIIKSRGFLLWGNSHTSGYVSPGSGPTPDWTTTGGGISDGTAGNPRGLQLRLADSVTVVDTVVYETTGGTSVDDAEGGLTAPGHPGSGSVYVSIERKSGPIHDESTGNGYDTNNNYNDFYRRTTRQPQNSDNAPETPPMVYDMEICENIDSIPSADNYTLEMRYKLANDNDNFRVQIQNALGTWDNFNTLLTYGTGAWTLWENAISSDKVIGGTVRVRFVGATPISTSQNSILIDYLRVRSQAAPWSTSVVMKLCTGGDNDPRDGGWSGWYEYVNGTDNPSLPDNRYVQYRIELSTTNENQTPQLSYILISIDNTAPPAPSLVSPPNGTITNVSTPTFVWTSVSDLSGVTYTIQVDNDNDFLSPEENVAGLTVTTYTPSTLADENYSWRVRAVDGAGNPSVWSSVWTLLISTAPYWLQTTWSGGPTTPSLQVGTWTPSYDNFYDNENVDWSASVKLKSQPGGVYENGWFESSIYDAGSSQNWGAVTWSASTPSFGGLDNYTYVSSYAAVKGTVENFENQKDNNSNSWSTLAEYTAWGQWGARAAYPGATSMTAACYAENAGVKYVYAFTGTYVYRYDIAANTWTTMYSTMPASTSGLSVVWNRADKIYWLSGGNAGTFYAYNISSNTISVALATPATGTPPQARYSNSGTTLAYDGGDNVYALLVSSASPYYSWIYAYSISGNSWTKVADTNPPENIGIGTGGGLIRLGNYLYVASSNFNQQSGHFLRYDLVNSRWDNLASLPSSGPSPLVHWDSGDGLENVGTNYIYANVGGSSQTDFFRFSISDNAWTHLENSPGFQSNAGDRLASDGTYLYLVRAYGDNSFWRYVTVTASYNMEICENIDSIPSADNYTLEMRYKLDNANDNFRVQIQNALGTWENFNTLLTYGTGAWTLWENAISSDKVVGGTVRVRFVDNNPNDTSATNLLKDYLRVRSQTSPWSTSVKVKLRTGGDNNPYDGAENWSGWCTHDNNTENISMLDNRYIQYRVELSTTDNTKTPEFFDITINYAMIDNTPPPVPLLVSPTDGTLANVSTPTFVWNSVYDPSGVTYQIQIGDNVVIYYAVNLTDNTHTLPDENALEMFIPYSWRVRAMDGVGNIGNWSETWNFTVVKVGEWWDSSWTRRRPITIAGLHPENYQIKIIIPYDLDMKSDYSDLRFCENKSTGVLNYWIENYTAAQAIVWVRRLENADNTIYMYYGNLSATSQSNENNVFIRVIDNVAGSWSFDENTGMTTKDNSGNNNTGTLENGPTWVAGKFSSAVNFDGQNDYDNVPDANSLDFTTEMTVMVWINADTLTGDYRGIIARGSQDGGEFAVWQILAKDVSFNRPTFLMGEEVVRATTTLQAGQWCHIAATYDGSNNMKIYVNGVLENTYNAPNPMLAVSNYPLYIGSSYYDKLLGAFFDGIIDEAAVYNRALDNTEVSDIYNNYGYVTPHYPGKALVRRYVSPEPTTSVGSEEEVVPPNKPTNLLPSPHGIPTSVISAFVTDNYGYMMNVFFYEDNATHSLIDNIWANSGTTASVVWAGLVRGQTYMFFARAQDNTGLLGENSDTQSFLVNSLPTTPTALTLTNPIKVGQILTATASGSTDADIGDAITYSYLFYNENHSAIRQDWGANTYTILAADNNDNIRVFAMANDGYENSTDNKENSIIVANTAPTAPTTLTLNSPKVGEVLTASASGSTDNDGDSITYYFKFYNENHSTIKKDWSTDNFYTIQTSDNHDNIMVYARASDGYENSSDKENSIIVANTAPTAPTTLTLNSPKVGEVLTASASGSTDNDGDSITYYIKFYNENHSTIRQDWSITNTYTILAADNHDNIRVYAKARDGYENSGEFENSIIVANTVPTKPTNLLPSTRRTSTSVTISCVGTDNDGDNIRVFFYDNSTKNQIDNVLIVSGGTASVSWNGLSRGNTYTFFARGQDNNGAWGENSDTQSFKVNSLPIAENQKAEGRVNPDNLTTSTPLLSWNYFDSDGDGQTQRQIQVGTVENGNSMWDSTVSTSAKSATYAGSALSSGVTYRWRVRVFDNYEWSSWLYGGTFKLYEAITRSVEVSISPTSKSGLPGSTLTYTVTVINTGTVSDNYKLENSDNSGWSLSLDNTLLTIPENENRTTTLRVTIPATAGNCTRDNVRVKATSQVDNTVKDNASCIAHAVIVRGVEVTIEPENWTAPAENTLTFTVSVTNTGEAVDNFDLTIIDDAEWGATLSENELLNVENGASGTVTVSVTIPSGTAENVWTEITVTATSRADSSATDSDTCRAIAGPISPPPGISLWVYVGVVVVIVVIIAALLIFIKPF